MNMPKENTGKRKWKTRLMTEKDTKRNTTTRQKLGYSGRFNARKVVLKNWIKQELDKQDKFDVNKRVRDEPNPKS